MTPLLLLPGMMCDARLFAPQIAAFKADRAVLVPSLAGADTVEALAGRILKDAPDRFALGGLSMGGIVAMEMLRQEPDRIERLALLDTNPLAEKAEMKAKRDPQMRAAQAGRLRTIMRDEMKPNYLADTPDRDQILETCMDMAMDLGPDVFISQSKALRDRPDQTKTLAAFEGPALILCGIKDQLCPPERHELMHALMPRSTLLIIDGAGHLPTLEQPEATNEALARWLLVDPR